MIRNCQQCGKKFGTAAGLRRHKTVHAPSGKFPCTHEGCDARLKTRDSLRAHVKTQHNDVFSHRCGVCSKGFQDRRKLRRHQHKHGVEQGDAQQAAAKVLGRAVDRLLNAANTTTSETAAEARDTRRPSVCCATCSQRALRNDPALFTCTLCEKLHHWTCAGLLDTPEPPLPMPRCVGCLVTEDRSPGAMAKAHIGREMTMAYVARIGCRVVRIPPDGWCLLSCVQRAASTAKNREELLTQAVTWVRDEMPLPHLDEVMRAEVRMQADEVLKLTSVGRRIGRLWNTTLWDFLPSALSNITGRTLHIYFADVATGAVGVTIIDEVQVSTEGGAGVVDRASGGGPMLRDNEGRGGVKTTKESRADNDPIRLLRSGYEYGCSHFDLGVDGVDCSV